MHYPVDPNDLQPTRSVAEIRAELGAEPQTPVIGTFAHLSIKKGYRELLQSAALVLRRMPAAQFWCFGEGVLRSELTLAARELGIQRQFKLFGFRRDVANLMPAIDVMCLPSHREPFGLVYVEAALAGKPVIACNAGGAPEIIVDGETGLLVPGPTRADRATETPSPNVQPLAEAILQLLDNRDRAAAMGRRGREQALERFQWPTYLARLHEIYERLRDRQPVDGGAVQRRAA
jgi:glycosyltransferase involved in cell wall biosynthesis